MTERRTRESGFTLIELMVSMAILALMSVYLTGMLTQQNRAYTVVDQVTEAQSNTRAISQILEREVRMSGALVPEGGAACGVDNTNAPDILYVTDSEALQITTAMIYELGANIDSGFDGSGTDTIRLNTATGGVVLDGSAFYDTDADGVADSDFRPGAAVIVIDPKNPERGSACGVIVAGGVNVAGASIDVDFSDSPGNLGVRGPGRPINPLVAIPAHRYMIDDQNRLMRDEMVLADDVEDFQVAFLFDTNTTLAGYEESYGEAGEPDYVANTLDHSELRQINFNFVTRARRTDPNFTGATFQATENRDPVPGTDGFRRRVYRGEVRVRNVGLRWTEEVS
jgi:prepilin-type N-terminal cleavage/methylation domain-containing protein